MTIVFGVLLVLLGIGGYLPNQAKTALIPAYVGIVLLIAGAVATKPNLRMHAMHAAVLVSLLGFLASAGRIGMAAAKGTFGENTLATVSLGGMAILTLIHVVMCVRSFIAARRDRQAAA